MIPATIATLTLTAIALFRYEFSDRRKNTLLAKEWGWRR